jgi:hypothetical protein
VTTTGANITTDMMPTEEFAEHAEPEDRSADARQQADAGITPERAAGCQDEIAARLLNDLTPPESQAYARAFSDNAARYLRQLRERDPLPEPDRTPAASHPDPFLASRGWHVNQRGIYTRRAEPEPQPRQEKDLEAG